MDGALKTALNTCLVGDDVSFDLRTLANDKLRSMNIGDNAAEDLQGALTDDVPVTRMPGPRVETTSGDVLLEIGAVLGLTPFPGLLRPLL